MTFDLALGGILAAALFALFLFALFRPERF